MTVRSITEKDLKAVYELYAAAWKSGYKGLLPQDFLDELTPKRWEGRFLEEGSFAALEGEKIVAHCHARAAAEPQMNGWGEIHTLYVHPDFWRKGYGTAVFRQAEKWLFQKGFADIYLYVLDGNTRAMSFYRSRSYIPNGDTVCCEVGGAMVTDYRFAKHFDSNH